MEQRPFNQKKVKICWAHQDGMKSLDYLLGPWWKTVKYFEIWTLNHVFTHVIFLFSLKFEYHVWKHCSWCSYIACSHATPFTFVSGSSQVFLLHNSTHPPQVRKVLLPFTVCYSHVFLALPAQHCPRLVLEILALNLLVPYVWGRVEMFSVLWFGFSICQKMPFSQWGSSDLITVCGILKSSVQGWISLTELKAHAQAV